MASSLVLYVAAAILIMTIVPFTVLCMGPGTNRKLLGLGSYASRSLKNEHLGASEKDVRKLLVERVEICVCGVGWVGSSAC